ncbi:ABC transporter permease [Aeromicrobium fastidiosum]|nr:ABC transporter permease [Aeromicrobium fastidiosum]MBP2389970.1 simple sugar transport system permease protein [Aeromicrobium fastidiosum]
MRDTRNPLVWPIAALAALLLINLVVSPSFFSIDVRNGQLYGNLIDILRNAAPTLLIAVGMTLVIATRGIDLSVGAIVAIAGAVTCTHIAGSSQPASASTALVAMGMAIALCLALGVWNGFLVSVIGIQPIIATLVLMTAGRGLAMLITDGQIVTVNNPTFSKVGAGFVFGVPLAILISGVVFAAVALVVRRTALGLLIQAVGINPEASRLAGVRSRSIVWTVYVFVAICAAVAGLMIASNTKAADANNAGLFIELDAILAVVIGGTSLAGGRFSLVGTAIGALFIQTLTTTVYATGIPPETTLVFKAVVVIAVCLLQSPKARAVLVPRRRTSPPAAAPSAPTPTAPTGA